MHTSVMTFKIYVLHTSIMTFKIYVFIQYMYSYAAKMSMLEKEIAGLGKEM